MREAAHLALAAGRVVHLLQWDVARLAFDTPEILARYPEVNGVTHAAIRVAVGRWARAALRRWDRAHLDPAALLIGETPLVGERLMELARTRADESEDLLAGERSCFIVPVPTREVRRAIEVARVRDSFSAQDRTSAPPDLVRANWADIARVAIELGTAQPPGPANYDPDVYAATYRSLLRHRHVIVMPLAELMSASAAPSGAVALVPRPDEVALAMSQLESMAPSEIARAAAEWYRP